MAEGSGRTETLSPRVHRGAFAKAEPPGARDEIFLVKAECKEDAI